MIIRLLIAVLVISGSALAEVGSSSFEFLLVGAGSRAAAMGEAYTAVSGDVGAPYFNPASAGLINGSEISFEHLVYLQDASMEQISAITPSGNFRLGLNMHVGQVPNFERRNDVPTDEPLGTFNEHNFALSFFWGYPVSPKLSIGNTVKFAYEKLDYGNATALGADFGAFYSFDRQIAFGISIRNIGTKPKFVQKSYDLPRELRLGFSYKGAPDSRLNGFLFAADYILPKWDNGNSKLNYGLEYNYDDFVFFRAGYNLGYDSRSFAAGAGLTYRIYDIDYAYVVFRHNLSDTHRITLRVRL